MPILTSGSSTTVTLGDYDSITLQNRPGQQASITVAGTLVNGAHTGSRTYGPYNSGTSVSITATVGALYYEVADGVAPTTPGSGSVAVNPATGRIEDPVQRAAVAEVDSIVLAQALDPIIVGAVTRDANGAAISASLAWPDGATGVYTATQVSSAFPGAVDAYTCTWVKGGVTRTYTQPAVTRDANGAVTNKPAMTVA